MTNGNMLIQPLLNIQPSMSEKMREEIQFSQLRKYSQIHLTWNSFRPQTIFDPDPFRVSSDSLYGKPDVDIWEEGIVKGITSGSFRISD